MIEILLLLGFATALSPLLLSEDKSSDQDSEEERNTDESTGLDTAGLEADRSDIPPEDLGPPDELHTPENVEDDSVQSLDGQNEQTIERSILVSEDVTIDDFNPGRDGLAVEIRYTQTEMTELYSGLRPIDASWLTIEISEVEVSNEISTRISIVPKPLPSIEWDSLTDLVVYDNQSLNSASIFGVMPTITLVGVSPDQLSTDSIMMTVTAA